MKPIIYQGLGGYWYFGCNLKNILIMKTFKEFFLDKNNNGSALSSQTIKLVIESYEKYQIYLKTEELKKEFFKVLEEAEIIQIEQRPVYKEQQPFIGEAVAIGRTKLYDEVTIKYHRK